MGCFQGSVIRCITNEVVLLPSFMAKPTSRLFRSLSDFCNLAVISNQNSRPTPIRIIFDTELIQIAIEHVAKRVHIAQRSERIQPVNSPCLGTGGIFFASRTPRGRLADLQRTLRSDRLCRRRYTMPTSKRWDPPRKMATNVGRLQFLLEQTQKAGHAAAAFARQSASVWVGAQSYRLARQQMEEAGMTVPFTSQRNW
jgi:hypothetical protein